MPAFWGCWSEDKFLPKQGKNNELKHSLLWENASLNEISGDNFEGAFIYNNSQNFDLNNYYYNDLKNSLSVIVTGSVYNLKELSENFGLSSQYLNTPELISSLYCNYGNRFFNSLNGDFCIIIINKNDNSIEIIRDHLGIHPCAFYHHSKHLYFSTDSLVLSKVFQDQDSINCQYLLNQLDSAHEWDYRSLPNRKVQRLLPGHHLKIEKGKLSIQKYWNPEKIKINNKLKWEKIILDFRRILLDSVKIRSIVDCKSATHLSGGLDSGIVAALARREYKDQEVFHGYSWAPFDNIESTDLSQEVNRIQRQSDFLKIEPKFQKLTLEEYISYISNWHYDLFIFHELKVLQEANKNKEKLIFSGWGGDEFISLNGDGLNSDLIFKFQWNIFFKRYPFKHPKQWLGALFYSVFLPFFYHHPRRITPELAFFAKYIHCKKCKTFSNRINVAKWSSRRNVHLKQLYNYHIPARTESLFNMGMTHGIEYRFPLLDKRIIEYMLTVPSKFLFKGNYVRRILRELSDEFLPKELNWINQKPEPGLYEEDKRLWKLAAEEIIKELPAIKKLPEFGIFNFEQLEKDIELYKNDKFTLDTDILCLFLVVLKKRYEFIKGYKNTQTTIG